MQQIPESYLARGTPGIEEWLKKHPHYGRSVTLDTRLSLNDLRRYTPSEVTKNAVWRWAKEGRKTLGGGIVKLAATFEPGGKLFTTLMDFHQFRLRIDPRSLIALGAEAYMVYCPRCDLFKVFQRDKETDARTTLIEKLCWQLGECGWRCRGCK